MPNVASVDLEDYFGTIDADIAYREMRHIGIKDQVVLNYIYKFIKKGYFEDSCKIENPLSVPHGSILGPLISNLYLHRFDVWLRDQGDCWQYDLTKEKFKFLGYMFYSYKHDAKTNKHRITNKLSEAKYDAIVERCRELLKAIKEKPCFETIHDWNVYVVGIHNYYRGMAHFLCVLSDTEHSILHSSTSESLYELFPKRKKRIKFLIEQLQK